MLAGFSKEIKRDFLINWVICRNNTAVYWRKLNQGIHWENLFTFTFLFCCAHKLNREKRCEISGMFWLKFLIFRFKLQCTTSLLHQIQGESKIIFCRKGWHMKYIIYENQGFEIDQIFDLPHWTTLYLSTAFVDIH